MKVFPLKNIIISENGCDFSSIYTHAIKSLTTKDTKSPLDF